MVSTNSLQLEGTRLQTYTAGSNGPAVVLLHGGGTDSALLSWKLTVPALAPAHRVFLADWPGYGQSQPLSSGSTNVALIELLGSLLNHWELERAILVGVSMGGGVALGFTLASPERVRALVLVDSYGLQDKAPVHPLSFLIVRTPGLIPWTWALMQRSRWMVRLALESIFHDRQAVTEDLVEEVVQAVRGPSVGRTFYAWQRSEVIWGGLRSNYRHRLADIRRPTLIIHGEQDSLVPLKAARQAHQGIEGSQLVILPDCGHWPQREQPQAFNQALLDFLSAEPTT